MSLWVCLLHWLHDNTGLNRMESWFSIPLWKGPGQPGSFAKAPWPHGLIVKFEQN